jgi:hypothetical protein
MTTPVLLVIAVAAMVLAFRLAASDNDSLTASLRIAPSSTATRWLEIQFALNQGAT